MGHTLGLLGIVQMKQFLHIGMDKNLVSTLLPTKPLFLCHCSVSFPFPMPFRRHCSNLRGHSSLSHTNMAQEEGVVSLQEWQGWGTTSPLPTMVAQIVGDLKGLEQDLDAHMSFGGNGGKLKVRAPIIVFTCSKVSVFINWVFGCLGEF